MRAYPERERGRGPGRPAQRGARSREAMTGLIRLELVLVDDFERGVLLGFAQHAIANHEQLDLVTHEATERVLRRADDRLAAHVEARVHQRAAAGLLPESGDQRVKARIG